MIAIKTVVANTRQDIADELMANAIPDPANAWLNPFQIKFRRMAYIFRAGLSEERALVLRRRVLKTPLKYFEKAKP